MEASLGGKWLELLSEIAPGVKRVAIMFNPDINPASVYFMLGDFNAEVQHLEGEHIAVE